MAGEIYRSLYINTLRATAWWLYQPCRKTPSFRKKIQGIDRETTQCTKTSLLFSVSNASLATGHAVSACGEIIRPGGEIWDWFDTVKFPIAGILAMKTRPFSSGSLVEAGNYRRDQRTCALTQQESPALRQGRMSNIPCRVFSADAGILSFPLS